MKSSASGQASKIPRRVLHQRQTFSRTRKSHSAFEMKIPVCPRQQAAHKYSSCIKRFPQSYNHWDISVPLTKRNLTWIFLHNHKHLWALKGRLTGGEMTSNLLDLLSILLHYKKRGGLSMCMVKSQNQSAQESPTPGQTSGPKSFFTGWQLACNHLDLARR